MMNKKKRDELKKEFWKKFKGTLQGKSVLDFYRTQSYYLGYLHGLLVTGAITTNEYSEMDEILTTTIKYEIKMKEERVVQDKKEQG